VFLTTQQNINPTNRTQFRLKAFDKRGSQYITQAYTQGRTEVRWRPGQETSLASPCSNKGLSQANVLYWNTCDSVRTFRRPGFVLAPLRPCMHTFKNWSSRAID